MTLQNALDFFGLKREPDAPEDEGTYPWTDKSGCSWDSLGDFVAIDQIGTCGCGDPESVARLFHEFLAFLDPPGEGRSISWDERKAWCSTQGGPLLELLLFYNLDRMGLTEHGTSVRGSWLTPKGEAVKALLAQVFAPSETL